MMIKSIALVFGSALMIVAGAAQATACTYKDSGWHRVLKTCDIHPANNWKIYNSGNYIQPVTDSSSGSTVFWPNKAIQ